MDTEMKTLHLQTSTILTDLSSTNVRLWMLKADGIRLRDSRRAKTLV